jgi:elongation factor P--beta-lysine ligase
MEGSTSLIQRLAKFTHDSWASRFEFYAGGLELGNAFEELTDPKEQRERFEKDMNLRESTYGGDFPKSEIDEDFIRALVEGIPPTSGIAVGLDRVVMLLAHEKDIDFTFWLPAYRKS